MSYIGGQLKGVNKHKLSCWAYLPVPGLVARLLLCRFILIVIAKPSVFSHGTCSTQTCVHLHTHTPTGSL